MRAPFPSTNQLGVQMPENDNIDDEFDDNENGSNDSSLVKNLRKQLNAAKKEAAEASKIAAELQAERKKASVNDLLTVEFKVDPKIAKFYDGDPSKEALGEWLTENADVFGIDLTGDDAETAEQAETVSRVTSNATNSVKAGSPEAIAHALATKSDAELIELGYIRRG